MPAHALRDLRVRSMAPDDLPAAAAVLAQRQGRLRASRAELPAAFTRVEACLPVLRAVLDHPGAHGVVLADGDRTVGYLAGWPRPEEIWGRAAWSPMEGCALADDVPAEGVRDLYAAWSEHFVRQGYFRQYVHAAVDDPELMAAWVRTGFGQMQAYALRDLTLEGKAPAGVTLRRAVPGDIEGMEPLIPLIAHQLMRPPAYAIRLPEELASYRDSWAEELSEPEAHHWVAEQEDGRILAMATFYATDPAPMVPDGAWELAVAMTLAEARGRGLMRALVAAGFAEARAAGATCCETDWRTGSLATHRTWIALGWRPTHYRMHRHVDERIAWAGPPPAEVS